MHAKDEINSEKDPCKREVGFCRNYQQRINEEFEEALDVVSSLTPFVLFDTDISVTANRTLWNTVRVVFAIKLP